MGDIGKKLESGWRSLGKSTGKAYKTGKLKMQISKNRGEIKKLATKLGERLIADHQRGSGSLRFDDPEIRTMLDEVAFYNKKIQELGSELTQVGSADPKRLT